MRESNSRQRFWRPLSYHLTNPLYIKYYEGSFTLIYYIHLSFVFQYLFLLYLQNFTQIFTNTKEVRFTSFIERPNDFFHFFTSEKWSSQLRFASSRWLCSANFSYLTHQTAPSASWLAVCWFRTSINKPQGSSIHFVHRTTKRLTSRCASLALAKSYWSSPRPISGSPLHTLLCFHSCPIYLILFQGSYFLIERDISSWEGLHA